ncbi:hypothetical protein IDJ81_01300 [Tsuneonella flava]|uniref:DUF2059 domain-containing protein n=2 Tax=Tsuneonella flava TaxID=2055955 RepID=A0ABX7K9A9_9SPHN|nr:hypothetical protein [Tsuneonella flava]QSB44840.1 hypothetical protein IDJ81_01300 [Tsuneonella flava]
MLRKLPVRPFLPVAIATTMIFAPVSAMAQDAVDSPAASDSAAVTSQLQSKLSDPQTQQQIAGTVAVLGEMLLDMPIAPLARSVAEAGGGDPAAVDPDMTLRKYAPGASAVPGAAAKNLPRMMDTMAGMAGGLEAMMPALRGMAERMQGALAAATHQPQNRTTH